MKRKYSFLAALFVLLLSNIVVADVVTSPKTKSSRSNYPRNAHHVAGGGGFAVEIRNGEVWGWGNNLFGQLGIGNLLQQELPLPK